MGGIPGAIPTDGLEAGDAACAEALSDTVPSAGVVPDILARHRDPPPPLTLTTPDALKLICEPEAPCDRNDARGDHGMDRAHVLDAMGQRERHGMPTARDEIITPAVKRQHEPQKSVADLLPAEITKQRARSVTYRMTIARRPLAQEINGFDFTETLIRDLAAGDVPDQPRNPVLIGGTGTGNPRLAGHIAPPCPHSRRAAGPGLRCGRSGEPARGRGAQSGKKDPPIWYPAPTS